MRLHRHRWEEEDRCPAMVKIVYINRWDQSKIEEGMQQVTDVLLRCEKCGDVKSKRIEGRFPAPVSSRE